MNAFLKSVLRKIPALTALALVLSGTSANMAAAESYTASNMRLLKYAGTVEIEDASGQPRFVLENVRFDSGESLKTGTASSASVGLDDDRIVTLDEETRVTFSQEGKHMEMFLSEGGLMLDVQDKLGDDETLDVKTSTMAVGIRGTIIFVRESEIQTDAPGFESVGLGAGHTAASGRTTTLGVLEGTAQLSFTDEQGNAHSLPVSAGQKATLKDSNINDYVDAQPALSELTQDDIRGFVAEQIKKSPALEKRVNDVDGVKEAASYPAGGNWTWDGTVTLVAQSASKLYDGSPLTRPGDVLVYGLPEGFSIRVSAKGSQTDAGTGDNPVGEYAIFNADNENVTSHFPNIEKVSGYLKVDPAPLTAWTGSASKTYDGTALTCKDAEIHFLPGHEGGEVPWRNTSYVVSGGSVSVPASTNAAGTGTAVAGGAAAVSEASGTASDSTAAASGSAAGVTEKADTEILYGICGTVWVHGTNPLTGEVREIELPAGKKMTVYLNDSEEDKQSIEFKIEDLSENELPEEVLRLYADNPALMEQACKDTGWDAQVLAGLIANLPAVSEENAAVVEQNGLQVDASSAEALMRDLTNVKITIDTDITDYSGRALGNEEAHYTGVHIDDSIKITATGSQTDVGESPNTYTIDWGGANPDNYIFDEELGTLTVTAAPAAVTTGSASKPYDGTPLTSGEASITGLVNGETATVTATGSITEPGSAVNSYTIDWGSTRSTNYALTEQLGTLTVTDDQTADITLTAGSASKTYDGTPLTSDIVTAEGLPDGFTCSAQTQGSQTDAGSSSNTVSSYTILNKDGKDVTDKFDSVETVDGKLTVDPAEATVKTGSAQKAYDGKALQNAEASITGLTDADKNTVTVTASGSITKTGTADNTYTIDWGSANSENYDLTEELGTLKVTKNDTAITFTAASDSKTYDGTPLRAQSVTVEGLPDGLTYKAKTTGTQTNAGTSASGISSYAILNQDGEDVTENFSNIKTEDGTLTVSPADLTIATGSAQKAYDGKALQSAEVSFTGLADADKDSITVTTTGSITKVGTADNTYTIDWGSVNSANYNLTENLGTLEVTKNDTPITFTSASASKTYDGTPISASSVTVEGLPEGFTWQASAGGSMATPPDVGEYKNTFDDMSYTFEDENGNVLSGWRYYVIRNADGEDVTDCFTNVSLVPGTLSITPLKITFELNCYEAVFCGYPLVPDGISGTYEDGGEVEEESSNMELDAFELPVHLTSVFNLTGDGQLQLDCGGYKDAGTYTVVPTETFLSGKAGNYEITYTNNTMTIDPMPVELTFSPDTVVFDGNAHSCELVGALCNETTGQIAARSDTEWQIYGYTIMLKETITVKIEGSYTNPGTYTLNPSYTFENNDPGNYSITPSSATLTIEPLELIVDLGDPEFEFDRHTHGGVISAKYGNGSSAGSPVTATSAVSNDAGGSRISFSLTTGDTLEVETTGDGPDPGVYTLSCSYKFTPDRASCYTITLTGNKLTIYLPDGATEGSNPSGAEAPKETDPAGRSTAASDTPGETDPAGQGTAVSDTPGETDPDGQSKPDSGAADNAAADGQGNSDSDAAGETDPAGQGTSGSAAAGETDPAGQGKSDSGAAGNADAAGSGEQGASSAPAAETEKKEKQTEPAEAKAPATEAEKKEKPAEPAEEKAPAAEAEKKEKQDAPAEADSGSGKAEKEGEAENTEG